MNEQKIRILALKSKNKTIQLKKLHCFTESVQGKVVNLKI